MKTVVLLDINEFETLRALLREAKTMLEDGYESSFYVGLAEEKLEKAIDILTEKGGEQE